jgi:hypothetical protein
MNKSDIRLEIKQSVGELRGWANRMKWASPALAKRLVDTADSIENSMAGRGFDSERALITIGKVEGLITASSVLMEEWREHNGGDSGMGAV